MKFTTAPCEKNTKLGLAFEGSMRGTMTWSLDGQGEGTKVNIAIDYEMRGGLLGKAMNALMVERMNTKNTQRMLHDFKDLCEAAN